MLYENRSLVRLRLLANPMKSVEHEEEQCIDALCQLQSSSPQLQVLSLEGFSHFLDWTPAISGFHELRELSCRPWFALGTGMPPDYLVWFRYTFVTVVSSFFRRQARLSSSIFYMDFTIPF